MGRSASNERFVAVYIGEKRLYRIGNADIVQYSDDEVDRPLRIGQWVMVSAELGEITKIMEIKDYVPTELDVKIEFRRSPKNSELYLARCSDLSEDILVPESLDTSAFNLEEEYGMIITTATQSEMNVYKSETSGETRWKLFLEQEEVFEEVQRPLKKCTINSKEDFSGVRFFMIVIRRTGIIVGVSTSGQTNYVYTPEEPVGMDGHITAGLGEPLELGDWIKFDVSAEEAQRIFLRKEKGNFTVLDYYKTDHLLPTTVNDNKGSIELLLENFNFSQECRSVSKKGASMIRHRELGLIADSGRYLDKFRIDSRLDIRIARTRQVKMHDTIWAVISVRPHKEGTVTRNPLVEVKRAVLPTPAPSNPVNNVAPRGNQEDVLDWRNCRNSEDKENTIKSAPNLRNKELTRKNGRRGRRNREHDASDFDTAGEVKSVGSRSARNEQSKRYRAFVTGISTIKTYLWVCDETNPRRSTMYILGENNTLKLGEWIEGDFKRVYITHEKRVQFVCVEDGWNLIESPVDIDTRRSRNDDGFQMVVVRVNVSYSAEKNCMINKYIGEIKDPRYLIPRDIIDREMFTAVITLSRRHNTSLYDWTIERLEPGSTPELQCRSEVEKKVKSVMESRVTKERRRKGEEEVVDKMQTLRVVKDRSRTDPPIVPGDWVNLKMRMQNGIQSAISASRSEPALTTIKHEGKIYLDVTVAFTKNDLYSEDMDDYIYVPPIANVDDFEFDVTYALLVTWMDPAERNFCASKTGSGSRARWKLAVNNRSDGSTTGLPISRLGYSFVPMKPTMTLMGLVVGQDSNDKRRFYVWCPGCPLHFDGIVVEDPKCLLKIGKFILFKIDRREYNDVFVHREPRHFYILCYEGVEKPPCEVYVTNVNGDDRRSKNIIKMMVVDFTRKTADMTRINDNGNSGFIFTHLKILISDDKGLLHKVPEGHMCNFMLIRQKPTEPWMTQWRVHEVHAIRRPPLPKKIAPKQPENGVTEAMTRLSVDTTNRPSTAQPVRSKSVEADRLMDRRIESAPVTPPSPPVLPSTPSTPSTPVTAAPSNGLFDDLDIDEHIAFVEAYCNRNDAVYLWIVDDPQQAVIWGCKGKRKPLVGSFLRGYFKQQADGRLYCNMEDYEPCGAPANIKVFDRSGHAIVRTDVLAEKSTKGESLWISKYLGLVEDVQRHMPRNVLDRERFTVQIGKRKQDKDFVWTIEMDVSKEQSHSSPQNGSAVKAVRKTSVPLRSPSSRGNGVNGGSITNGMNGGYSSNETSADTTLNDHSGASSLNVTADIDDGEEEELELPLTPRREPSPTETLSPLDLPSPGFDSRKTSVDEHEDHYSSRPPSRASAVDHPSGNHFYQLDEHVDNVWNDDTMRAREEPDPVMEIIETFANGSGLLDDPNVADIFSRNMDPARYHRLMQLSDKFRNPSRDTEVPFL
ncbi:hypothetical protein PRIPAC_77590 [Pristionchus pacificus]|uniref:Uncharacterized protein n=1 Tax=Pristionchus pacificus TaxID=54126 RepID=A0A2A6CAT8_PRIPA|nr:hypothetical protein PRIPAC_77590 [Pristionchus pacificus]|eukprot:PDM75345.1 hypothetical protein PRIPAC_42522 [Pristionchus pacificus]